MHGEDEKTYKILIKGTEGKRILECKGVDWIHVV
jgi:hypothetical protein